MFPALPPNGIQYPTLEMRSWFTDDKDTDKKGGPAAVAVAMLHDWAGASWL